MDKDLLGKIFPGAEEKVKSLILSVISRGWGKNGGEIYAAALADPGEDIRLQALRLAKLHGSHIEPAAKAMLRSFLATADKEALSKSSLNAPVDVRLCFQYLEEAYRLGEQGTRNDKPLTVAEYARRLLDATDKIDKAVDDVAKDYQKP
jgi:hypothetical protein